MILIYRHNGLYTESERLMDPHCHCPIIMSLIKANKLMIVVQDLWYSQSHLHKDQFSQPKHSRCEIWRIHITALFKSISLLAIPRPHSHEVFHYSTP